MTRVKYQRLKIYLQELIYEYCCDTFASIINTLSTLYVNAGLIGSLDQSYVLLVFVGTILCITFQPNGMHDSNFLNICIIAQCYVFIESLLSSFLETEQAVHVPLCEPFVVL